MRSKWWWVVGLWLMCSVAAGAAHAQITTTDEDQGEEKEEVTKPPATSAQKPTPAEAEATAARREEIKRALSGTTLLLPGAVDPESYHLGPGDVLQVSIWGGISRSMTFEVSPEGTVLLPTSGTMKVDGLSLKEGRAQIMSRLRPEFHGVSLDVRLLRPRRFVVYVTGRVKVPGAVDASGASRVSDLVLAADPLANASLRRIEVTHRDGTREIADLQLFLRTASQELNPWVRDGDVLHVPIARNFVSVEGAVSQPMSFEQGPRDSLRTLIALAGGMVPSADSTRALLLRWIDPTHSESLWVNPTIIDSRSPNPPLASGDHLYVYYVPQFQLLYEVAIRGEVERPGSYPIKFGHDRLSDVIRSAGGFLPGADLGAVRVRRLTSSAGTDPELQRLLRLSRAELTNSEYDVLNTKLAGQREEYRIDWNRMQKSPELDVLMVGGDVVQVDRVVNSIRVDGQVRRPGFVSYRPGGRVDDYVGSSGGYSERAWRTKIRVTRSVTGQTFLARDVQSIDPGDFIWVPERPDVTFWDQTRTVLAAAAEIATVFLAFRSVGK